MDDGSDAKDLLGLVAIGLTLWVLAAIAYIAWFFAQPGEKGLAAVGVPFLAWLIGYVPGGVLMLGYGLFASYRRQIRSRTVLLAGVVYFLPLALTLAAAVAALRVAPTHVSQNDMGGMIAGLAGPLFAFLFLVGLVQGFQARRETLAGVWRRIFLPQLIGGFLLVGWIIVSALASSEMQSRGVVDLTVKTTSANAEGVVVEGVVTLKKDADYEFKALLVHHDSGLLSRGELRWVRGNDTPKSSGDHPLRISFDITDLPRQAMLFFDIYQKSSTPIDPGMPYVDLVRTLKIELPPADNKK